MKIKAQFNGTIFSSTVSYAVFEQKNQVAPSGYVEGWVCFGNNAYYQELGNSILFNNQRTSILIDLDDRSMLVYGAAATQGKQNFNPVSLIDTLRGLSGRVFLEEAGKIRKLMVYDSPAQRYLLFEFAYNPVTLVPVEWVNWFYEDLEDGTMENVGRMVVGYSNFKFGALVNEKVLEPDYFFSRNGEGKYFPSTHFKGFEVFDVSKVNLN